MILCDQRTPPFRVKNPFQDPQLVEASTGTERPDLINKIGKRIRFIIIVSISITNNTIMIRFRRKKKEKIKTENRAKKALKTISLILGAFVTCWTPYHILAIVRLDLQQIQFNSRIIKNSLLFDVPC